MRRPLIFFLAIAAFFVPLAVGFAEDSCRFDNSNKAFNRQIGPALSISSKFIAQPPQDADPNQLKKHFIYSRILGRYASRQVYRKSLNRCSFLPTIDASGTLDFELVSINENVHDECSLNRCASLLANVFESTVPNLASFLEAVELVANADRKFTTPDPKYPRLVLARAAQEAYRHIYPAGTRERVFVDVSTEDFSSAKFSDFNSWFETQQQLLQRGESARQEGSSGSNESVQCSARPNLDVQQVNIDGFSKGFAAIILINHGFGDDGSSRISSPVLKSLCEHSDKESAIFLSQGLGDINSKIECMRGRLNRDRWLVIYGKDYRSIDASDMGRLAKEIGQKIALEQCPNKNLAIYVANFLLDNGLQ